MHSHVLNFKADFDILGQSNSVQLMSVVPTTKTYPCESLLFRGSAAPNNLDMCCF